MAIKPAAEVHAQIVSMKSAAAAKAVADAAARAAAEEAARQSAARTARKKTQSEQRTKARAEQKRLDNFHTKALTAFYALSAESITGRFGQDGNMSDTLHVAFDFKHPPIPTGPGRSVIYDDVNIAENFLRTLNANLDLLPVCKQLKDAGYHAQFQILPTASNHPNKIDVSREHSYDLRVMLSVSTKPLPPPSLLDRTGSESHDGNNWTGSWSEPIPLRKQKPYLNQPVFKADLVSMRVSEAGTAEAVKDIKAKLLATAPRP